jgi:hypothetical protein
VAAAGLTNGRRQFNSTQVHLGFAMRRPSRAPAREPAAVLRAGDVPKSVSHMAAAVVQHPSVEQTILKPSLKIFRGGNLEKVLENAGPQERCLAHPPHQAEVRLRDSVLSAVHDL